MTMQIASIRRTSWSGISQFEGKTRTGDAVYARLRNGTLTLEVGGQRVLDIAYGDRDGFDIDWDEIECVSGFDPADGVEDVNKQTGVRLRPARADDVEAIAQLFRRVRDTCLPYLPRLHTPDEDKAFFADVVATCKVTVAETETIIGFSASSPGWIEHLYLDPRFHGRRIGHKLMRVALADQYSARLWVFQRNTDAIAFYGKLGFAEDSRTDGAGNEEKCPDLLMTWKRR